jgi:hypothetical protein
MTSTRYCRNGNAVSKGEAFLPFEKWRKSRSYIVLRSVSWETRPFFQGTIVAVKTKAKKLLFDKMTPSNSNRLSSTGFDLRNASFECTEPHESLDGDLLSEDWDCCLSARLRSGELLVFAVHKKGGKCF